MKELSRMWDVKWCRMWNGGVEIGSIMRLIVPE